MRPLYIQATVELCCFLPRRWTGLARVASSVQFRYFGLKFEPSSRWHDTCIQKTPKKKVFKQLGDFAALKWHLKTLKLKYTNYKRFLFMPFCSTYIIYPSFVQGFISGLLQCFLTCFGLGCRGASAPGLHGWSPFNWPLQKHTGCSDNHTNS